MAMEHAKNFVEKFFEDDEFIKTIVRKRGFTRYENKSEDDENAKIVKAANEMGFKFDLDEYKTANKEYMNNLGGWEAAQRICHMLKVVMSMSNEN